MSCRMKRNGSFLQTRQMIRLRYGNTNTFFIEGSHGGILFDTDYAGTLHDFYKAMKKAEIQVRDIRFVLASHYHPDHMGLIGDLQRQGVRLILMDIQKDYVHASDHIFEREKSPFTPVDEDDATVITCRESRTFLHEMGIEGEIFHTPSHSEDSVSLILDSGECFLGDITPFELIEGYEDNRALKSDWELINSYRPRKFFYAHGPE